MKYDVNYFIDKFTAIPDELWTIGELKNTETDACCALGHCGVTNWKHTEESLALAELIMGKERFEQQGVLVPGRHATNDVDGAICRINDKAFAYKQETPKLRMLAALNDVKTEGKAHNV